MQQRKNKQTNKKTTLRNKDLFSLRLRVALRCVRTRLTRFNALQRAGYSQLLARIVNKNTNTIGFSILNAKQRAAVVEMLLKCVAICEIACPGSDSA